MSGSNTGTYSIGIRAVDGTTSVFKRINDRLERIRQRAFEANAPMRAMRAEMDRMGRLSGMSVVSERLRGLGTQAATTARNVGLVGAGLVGLGSVGTAAGILRIASAWGNMGTRIASASRLIGVSATTLNRIRNAAEISGAAPEDVDSSIRGLQDRQRAARNGDGEAARLLGATGIGLNDRPEVAFNRAMAALRRFRGTPEARRALMAQLGISESLDGLSRDMDRYLSRADRVSTLTEEQVRNAEALGQNQRELSVGLREFGQTLVGSVAPALTPVIASMTRWLTTNREWLQSRITDAIKAFGEWVSKIDFGAIITGAQEFLSGVNSVVESLGGWQTVITGIIGLKLGSWVLGVVGAVASLTSALGLLAGSYGLPILARLIPALGLGALGVGAGMVHDAVAPDSYAGRSFVQGGLYGAGLGAAAGSVVPIIGTGLGALAGGAIGAVGNGLYQNWSSFRGGSARPTNAPASAEARYAYQYFIRRGLSPAIAAGLVANMEKESGFRVDAVGDGGRAYGTMQWHPDRQAEFARLMGRDIRGSSFDDQLEFVLREMGQGREARAGQRLAQATTPGQAGAIASLEYLRPADREGEAAWRGRRAENLHAQFNGGLDVTVNVTGGQAQVTANARGDVNAPRVNQALPPGGIW